jgi:hypothetical protein
VEKHHQGVERKDVGVQNRENTYGRRGRCREEKKSQGETIGEDVY